MHTTIGIDERKSLLGNIDFFRIWNDQELTEVAALMQETQVDAGTVIVNEGDLIDAVFLLVKGQAEVTRKIVVDGKSGIIFVALLTPGEEIGLKEAGLYSDTGTRTATVTTTTTCTLLKLKLDDFHDFLTLHPNLTENMEEGFTETFKKMQAIKNAIPFAKLSDQRIAWMVGTIKEIELKEGEVIFYENEITDSCYMVYEGKVEICILDADGHEKRVNVIEPGTLFGENALINEGKRNATARALTPCRLLVLDKDMLLELTAKDTEATGILKSMILEKSHPVRQENVVHQQRTLSSGETITILKNLTENKYCQLNALGWYIWQQLDGKKTLSEIIKLSTEKFKLSDSEEIEETLEMFFEKGFAILDVISSLELKKERKDVAKQRYKKIWFFSDPDKKMDFLYRRFGFLFFYLPIFIGIIVLDFVGIYYFTSVSTNFVATLKNASNLFFLIFFAAVTVCVLRMLNPLAKAMVLKHHKRDISGMGFRIRVFFPELYIDTTDILMSDRWPRVSVFLSGFLADLLVAGLISLYMYFNESQSVLLWLCCLMLYMEVLRAFNPMVNLDGYRLLGNILDVSHLRTIAVKGILHWKKIRTFSKARYVVFFWIYTLVYLILVMVVTEWILGLFTDYLPTIDKMYFFVLAIVLLAFLVEVIIVIRRRSKLTHLVEMV